MIPPLDPSASFDDLRALVGRLGNATAMLAALAVAMERRIVTGAIDPRLAHAVDDVVAQLGASTIIARASPADLRSLLADLRTFALDDVKLAVGASAGWHHHDAALLDAAGEVSAGMPNAIATRIAPALDGLEDRLASPGAAFLDVGVGVAAMSIAMAQRFPALRIVGVDPLEPAIALARQRVGAAGLDDRIELRHGGAEDLVDVGAFDLAWIPSAFVPPTTIPAVLERVRAALRPGGWLLFPIMRVPDDPLLGALVRLRVASFGGLVTTPHDAEGSLRERGFVEVRTLPSPPNAFGSIVVGRR